MKNKLTTTLCIMAIASPIHANYPSLVGDVVARDLDISGGRWLGHVGLANAPHWAMSPTLVLQAMADSPHIQEVSVDNFKSASNFWGSRGGILPLTNGQYNRFTVANRLVRQYYACPAYSYTPYWFAGSVTDQGKPISCGLFRCDTLVNYAYAFDSRYSLPTYDTKWTTPIGVWNSFFIDTDLLIPERHQDHTPTQSTTNETINSISESNLKDLTTDTLYQMFVNSENISLDQVDRLWKLFTSHKVDNQTRILFYDFMAFQDISHLTNDIIKQAKIEDGEARHRLLIILQVIYQKKLGNKDKAGLEPIINYFKELQNTNLDKDDSGIVYRGIAAIAPKEIKAGKINMINMDKIHVAVFSLKSDRANELAYVKDIISNLDHPDDTLVITATYQYLTELLINSDLKFFSDESKALFRAHLAHRKMTDLTQTMLYTSAYVEFKAVLNAKVIGEIPALATGYMQSLDAGTREVTPYGFSESTQKQLNIHIN